MKKWRSIAAGAGAGLANGLFGAGGGMILVPLLGVEGAKRFATALCVMTPLCLVSLVVYAIHGTLAMRESVPYLTGGFLGGLCGGLLLRRVPVRLLHAFLGLLIIWGGLRLWRF